LLAFCALNSILLLSLIPLASAVFITLHVDIYEFPLHKILSEDPVANRCIDPSIRQVMAHSHLVMMY
jgi:hypothetical protein